MTSRWLSTVWLGEIRRGQARLAVGLGGGVPVFVMRDVGDLELHQALGKSRIIAERAPATKRQFPAGRAP